MMAFITIRFLDILDIFLVALLLYQLYRLIKGTVAFNIVIGLFSLYLLWLVVRALNMQLLGSIMGQFIGVGVLALIIVFHPEIRKFLVFIGTNYNVNRLLSIDKLFGTAKVKTINQEQIENLVDACVSMAKSKTGALIVIAGDSELTDYINTGEKLNARISSSLIRTIFFKNSPLHDGAIIIKENKIKAAGCILPLTQKELDQMLGLRHRAAVGITESTDAVVVIVSEERGSISFTKDGEIKRRISKEVLTTLLEENIVRSE
ncbi:MULTISPECIES: diadenylate cyclase CdaA [Maribellus]|uniref:Diadenylate cyclase n=1 Tax=Maribellus comscasis TaxID=2681766 RepID=A0A6I6JW75_9BACT|nr:MULTISPECIES: diadenylate cyclase CdaA [Maribellus]MCG6186771.1 diadenylate cyclase CdaA [Maribellus maritimus]QGY45559.1 TIGR00159 family protein [Maribellus comscasis]